LPQYLLHWLAAHPSRNSSWGLSDENSFQSCILVKTDDHVLYNP
jgi:hypothetical protein